MAAAAAGTAPATARRRGPPATPASARLLFDLLTPAGGARSRANVFDIDLLADGFWSRHAPGCGRSPTRPRLPIGYFGASTGAAAALAAAAAPGAASRRWCRAADGPTLPGDLLGGVWAPTLLIVGGARRRACSTLNRAGARLGCVAGAGCAVVAGATHLFEEPGTLAEVAALATGWFLDHLVDALPPGAYRA